MCQPIPASPNSRTDRFVNTSSPRSAAKIKSPTDGSSHRTHAGCRVSAAELVESIAIALNLIEWGEERQQYTSSGAPGGDRGGGLWWPQCRRTLGSFVRKNHGYRSKKSPHFSAVALSGSHRGPFPRRDHCTDPVYFEPSQERRSATRRGDRLRPGTANSENRRSGSFLRLPDRRRRRQPRLLWSR